MSVFPQQPCLTALCQKQVFNISLSVEAMLALIGEHAEGQLLKFNESEQKFLGFKKALHICGHQQ